MITHVSVEYFKIFYKQDFELSKHIVLAGPNNAGKTTLIQAIAVWNMALQKWISQRGPNTKSQAKLRTGVPITRSEFSAIPLREMNLLWTNTTTGLTRDELQEGQKLGYPRPLTIRLKGGSTGKEWNLAFEIRYQNKEFVYIKPTAEDINDIPIASEDVHVVHVPPFSGIGPLETRQDRPYQDMLIGQGKPGDILRNLLLELYQQSDRSNWEALQKEVKDIFGFTLLAPQYEGMPYILSEYQPGVPMPGRHPSLPRFDISNAGSGFHQVLVLLGFLYARPATVLLLDEPDAHQHVILQKQIYDRLRSIAKERNCQLIIATHSEVIVDNTSPSQILSFYREPHSLVNESERNQVREALKRITAMDILLAESSPGVLYVEGETDFNLLKAWARALGHERLKKWFDENPFWHNNKGRNPSEARSHFFALRAIRPEMRGYLLLDGDNRDLPEHELGAEGLMVGRWTRYEAESYLLHPDALFRYISHVSGPLFAESARTYMQDELPPAILRDPLGDHDYLRRTPSSNTILPHLLDAGSVEMTKNEYFLIAEQMLPHEVAAEVKQKLDAIADTFGL